MNLHCIENLNSLILTNENIYCTQNHIKQGTYLYQLSSFLALYIKYFA